MWTKIIAGIVTFCALAGVARADIDDDKPWDWSRYESYILRNKDENGICDAVAKDTDSPDLKCAFDKKAWDDHLAKEIKIERIRKRNHQDPGNCDGGGFQSFRGTGSNGQFPDNSTDQVKLVQAEFRKNVALLVCTFDDNEKDPSLTYDAGKRTLTIHLTRQASYNSMWIKSAMREGALLKAFPMYDKFFRKYE